MQLKRVVVTGLGAITPLGNSVSETWDKMLKGVSGAGPITYFDASKFKTRFACEVKNFDASLTMDKKEARRLDRFTQYAIAAAHEAFLDSGIDTEKIIRRRAGVIWGSGIGGIQEITTELESYYKTGETPRFNPFLVPKMILDIAAGHISIRYGFNGPNYAVCSACATATNNIIDAFNLIRLNKADIIISGGSEAPVTIPALGGFSSAKALSERNDDPHTASRPFDKDRDGFVIGEGGGALLLEELEHAKARGAKIYAEVAGGGMSGDAYHITAPHPEGLGAQYSMENAFEDAGITPDKIDYVNVHGTSTPMGDPIELKAVAKILGEHIYKTSISSTKSMTGHGLGAAGAFESIACILAIRDGIIPPTINLFNLDPAIDPKLDLTPNVAKKRDVNYALNNTFGFGGHNASVIFKKYSE